MINIPEPLPSELGEHHKGHGLNWYKWLHQFIGKEAVGLELGSFKGESAEYMLDHFFTHPDSRYYCVDTFEGSEEHRIGGIDCTENEDICRKRLARFGDKAWVIKGYSDQALRGRLRDMTFDFIYVDAAHDAMNVLRDSVLAFDMLNVGGVMLWDDYEWRVMEHEIDRPKMAVDAFLECYARRLEIIGMGWQVCCKKIA